MHEPAADRPCRASDVHDDQITVFDREGVRRVDRAATEEYGIPGMVLMENAARGLLIHASEMLDEVPAASHPRRVLILCGSGNNGGDGYALARHLHNHGHEVTLAPIGQPRSGSDAHRNRAICRHMRLMEQPFDEVEHGNGREFDLIVDAIFGTGLDRPVTADAARAIKWINAAARPTLAVDVPSGLDCDTGRPLGVCVQATRTVTFVGLKIGFLGLDAQKLLGEVQVADIGAPREVIERFGRRVRLPRSMRDGERIAETPEAAPRRD
jgi:NAD(P)H-hydrate epimerase